MWQKYFYEVRGRHGWKARYIKDVDAEERTVRFYQEIFDEDEELMKSFPLIKGIER